MLYINRNTKGSNKISDVLDDITLICFVPVKRFADIRQMAARVQRQE